MFDKNVLAKDFTTNNDEDDSSIVESDLSGSEFDERQPEKTEEGTEEIARAETRAVRSLKLIVLAVLVFSALGVGLAVYFLVSQAEQDQFETAFAGDSQKVMEACGKSLERSLSALDAYTVSLVSSARQSNQTWPFVTIPDFAVRTAKVRSLSDSVIIVLHPIVMPEQRLEWEAYSMKMQGWVNESMKVQEFDEHYYGPVMWNQSIYGVIHNDFYDIPYNSTRPMMPMWQNSPVVGRWPAFNWDVLSVNNPEASLASMGKHRTILSGTYNLPDMSNPLEVAETEAFVDWFSDYVKPGEDPGEPAIDICYPVIDNLDTVHVVDEDSEPEDSNMVAMILVSFYWRDVVKDILPRGSDGVVVVFEGACNPSFTYEINGPTAKYLGRGDLHETKYDYLELSSNLLDLDSYATRESTYTGIPVDRDTCPYTIRVFPSSAMQAQYTTTNPIVFTVVAVLIFVFTSAVFLVYDFMVERRQKKVMTTAVRSSAIVSSLFPSVVRDRLYPTEGNISATRTAKNGLMRSANKNSRMTSYCQDGTTPRESGDSILIAHGSKPIADLFPDTTVMFADIAGFTAWSSTRDPAQVFTLLETLYGAFDALAKMRGVFKVETIGDSYVAVCGLPQPRKYHAAVMVKFAYDCHSQMCELTRKLEKTLGPDTGDLKMRIGLNSGPVTGGVLRGEKSRFQLFGDTVNTAARMESNGEPNRIQVSQKTADLLVAAGKGSWLTPRKDLVQAKGKGTMQTFWVEPKLTTASVGTFSESYTSSSESSDTDPMYDLKSGNSQAAKLERLIDWNLETFGGLLKTVVVQRGISDCRAIFTKELDINIAMKSPRQEVLETITLPVFNAPVFNTNAMNQTDSDAVILGDVIVAQLRSYISGIAYMYQENPFHNFEHASHVAASAMKLLQRVVSTSGVAIASVSKSRKSARNIASDLHKSTHGITSDPLTQFAIVFAALIHDVDHQGVTNAQLVAENNPLALHFENKSVAEQNSVELAWDLFMDPRYEDLRSCLFASEVELKRFRQLVVNAVMATDIFDKELKADREARWEKAFPLEWGGPLNSASSKNMNRKATIVIECIIQASDVAHTMQHWKVYQKWNSSLYQEMYAAFKSGRSEKDPTEGWYNGELWFFDNYIIPLAKKLPQCGVFGVSCDELLDYALDNRQEWESKGRAIVEEMRFETECKYSAFKETEAGDHDTLFPMKVERLEL